MITTQPLEVYDFSAGMTDNFIDGAMQQSQVSDNLLITSNKKLRSRPGSALYDESNPQIPAGAQRIGAVINWQQDKKLLVQSARNVYHYLNGWQPIFGPNGNVVFEAGTINNSVSWSEWDRHLYVTNDTLSTSVMKIITDQNGAVRVLNAGLPNYPDNPGLVVTPGAGLDSYIYAFVYFNAYNIEGTIYEDYGTPLFKEISNAATPDTNAIAIAGLTQLPVVANYPTTAKVRIFRTISNGQSFYYVGEVDPASHTFSDTMPDATLQNQPLLYTQGDVLNDPPPISKYVHIVNGIALYGYIKEGDQIFPNRIRQSVPGDPDSCPSDFYGVTITEIAGISSVNGIAVVLTRKGIYRIDGFISETGAGDLTPTVISDVHGCVSSNSIVQTQRGIFWAGLDGFCFSNGMDVMKISNHLNTSYAELIKDALRAKRIVGTLSADGDRVYWAVQKEDGSLDNDTLWVLDLRWGLSQTSSFTTVSGGASFSPSAIGFFKGEFIRADSRGYILVHRDELRSDPVINPLTPPSQWSEQAIIYNYISCATNFGTQFMRKWVPKIIVNAENEGRLHLQIKSCNDNSGIFSPLAAISFTSAFAWGEPDFVWGDPALIWNYNHMIEEKRRFPAKGLRLSRKQVQLTNAFTLISKSTTSNQGIADKSSKTVTFSSASSYTWPTDSVGFYISFSYNNFATQHLIIARSDTTISYVDANQVILSGTYDWIILGYPKNEILHLLGYTLEYGIISQTQKPFQADTDGRATWT